MKLSFKIGLDAKSGHPWGIRRKEMKGGVKNLLCCFPHQWLEETQLEAVLCTWLGGYFCHSCARTEMAFLRCGHRRKIFQKLSIKILPRIHHGLSIWASIVSEQFQDGAITYLNNPWHFWQNNNHLQRDLGWRKLIIYVWHLLALECLLMWLSSSTAAKCVLKALFSIMNALISWKNIIYSL